MCWPKWPQFNTIFKPQNWFYPFFWNELYIVCYLLLFETSLWKIPLNDSLCWPDWAKVDYFKGSHSNTTLSPKPLPCLLWVGPSPPLTVDTMREQPVAWWLSQFPPPCQNTKQKQSKPCFYSLQADSRNHCCVTCAVLETFMNKKKKTREKKEKQKNPLRFDSWKDGAQTFLKALEHIWLLSLHKCAKV